MSTLAVHSVRVDLGDRAVLRGVDLDVAERSLAAVLGPSGCGKTTLLRTIAGFIRATAGTVTIDGRVVADDERFVEPEHRRIGLVPQEGALFPHLSVGANVGYGLGHLDRRTRRHRVGELLEVVGLAGAERRRPGSLSGGQQHRVALARALAPKPQLSLLDEPFAALDAALRGRVRADVIALLRETGTTAILVTHDQAEALDVADQVAVMFDGSIVQAGSPDTVYSRPVSSAVASFVGAVTVVEGTRRHDVISSDLGPLHSPGPDGMVEVLIRPEEVTIAAPGSGVRGTVVSRSYFGHDGLVEVELVSRRRVAVRLTAAALPPLGEQIELEVGEPVWSIPR